MGYRVEADVGTNNKSTPTKSRSYLAELLVKKRKVSSKDDYFRKQVNGWQDCLEKDGRGCGSGSGESFTLLCNEFL